MPTDTFKKAFYFDSENEKMWDGIRTFVGSNKDLLSFYKSKSEVSDIDVAEDVFLDEWMGQEYLELLKRLHEKKYLYKTMLKNGIIVRERPFVVEFTGTPRSGKTTVINSLKDFFKKAGFKVVVIEELTTSPYYKEMILPKKDSMSLGDYNLLIIEESSRRLIEAVLSDADIILIDRGINDRQVWNYLRLLTGDIDSKTYRRVTKKYSDISKQFVDSLFVFKTDSQKAVSRDYLSSICLETRRFNKMTNINRFNGSLDAVTITHEESVNHYFRIDANNRSPYDISIIIANQILNYMLNDSLDSVIL